MTVVAVDDTDSRTEGMCTTYLAARLAERLPTERRLLVRLSPAVAHKTRGNAAVAVHTTAAPARARAAAVDLVESYAVGDASTGVVVAPDPPDAVAPAVASFARTAVRRPVDPARALSLLSETGYDAVGWGDGRRVTGDDPGPDGLVGRGRVGALAAVGAWRAFSEWTYERIDYRRFERCGTPREVDVRSVFAAAADGYPAAWDTVDRVAGEAVCVPNAPGPILYGIRGDDPDAVAAVAESIEAEPVARSAVFVTNQGTDAHLQPGAIGDLRQDRAYRVDGTVTEPPTTRAGGHVFFELGDDCDDGDNGSDGNDCDDAGDDGRDGSDGSDGDDCDDAGDDGSDGNDGDDPGTIDCVAFEPTGRFRDRVRALRVGDSVTVCGEYDDGTVKLEKFAVRALSRTERVVPECPECGRSMESAGRGQGYRCRDCRTAASGKATVTVERELEPGWYEVPPSARRHVARPLVRGGFDAPTHPEW